MNELIFKEELIENWIKILLIISTFLIMAARLISGEKFQFLIKFWNIHRYFIYKSGSSIPFFTSLNSLMFIVRVIVFSLFLTIYLFPNNFSEFQLSNYLIISGIISLYIVFKYFIEKIISIIFNFRNLLKEMNRFRIGLKNLISLHFYFYLIILIFNPISNKTIITVSFILYFIYLFFSSNFIFKKFYNNNFKSLVYFILYLCTFEIAPATIVMLQAFKY